MAEYLEVGEKTYFEYSYTVKEEDVLKGIVQNIVTVENDKVKEEDSKEVPTSDISKDLNEICNEVQMIIDKYFSNYNYVNKQKVNLKTIYSMF